MAHHHIRRAALVSVLLVSFGWHVTYCSAAIGYSTRQCHDDQGCPGNQQCMDVPGGRPVKLCSCNDKIGKVFNGSTCSQLPSCPSSCNCPSGFMSTTSSSGFEGVTHYSCNDINECQSQYNVCPSVISACTNTEGQYACLCNAGFTGNGSHCWNVNECLVSPSSCHSNATCSDTVGSYDCSCKRGFSGNGTSCSNINECLVASSCDSNATCTDTIGSFLCKCNDGFIGNGSSCRATYGCLRHNNCHPNATCGDIDSNYKCRCNAGFTGNGTYCKNIDECLASYSRCHTNAMCRDTDGSYICSCETGFTGNGTHCENVNECLSSDRCHSNATCNDTDGSYSCSCAGGLTGNGTYCENVDECLQAGACHANSLCNDTDGSFLCQCSSGYTGTHNCSNIDECEQLDSACDSQATCADTAGSYTCTCNSGFTGDGTVCWDLKSLFCDGETLLTLGFGEISWRRTMQGQSASVDCPADNPSAMTAFGTRHCGGNLGHPTWQTPLLSYCLVKSETTQKIFNLTQDLVASSLLQPVSIQTLTNSTSLLEGILSNNHAEASMTGSITESVATFLEFVSAQSQRAVQQALNATATNATADDLLDITVKLVTPIVNIIDEVSQAIGRTSETKQVSQSAQRITSALEKILQSMPLPMPDEAVRFSSKTISISVVCPSSNESSYTAYLASGKADIAAVVNIEQGLRGNTQGDALRFVVPPEAISTAALNQAEEEMSMYDCQLPKINFIVYEDSNLFQDTGVGGFLQNSSSRVISAKVGTLEGLVLNQSHVQYTLQLPANITETTCAFWNRERGHWSSEGCTQSSIDQTGVTCQCNHLTNFAVLFSLPGAGLPSAIHAQALMLICTIGCSLSLVGLFMTAFTTLCCRTFRNRTHFKLMGVLALTMLLTIAVFIVTINFSELLPANLCRALGMAQHLLLLMSFGWMMLQATHVYKHLVVVFSADNNFLKKYSVLVVAVPIVIVAVTAGVSKLAAYDTNHMCWFSNKWYFYTSLIAPLFLAVTFNTSILVLVSFSLTTKKSSTSEMPVLKILRIIFSLSVLVGAAWVFGALLPFVNSIVLQYAFAVLVSLQGFMLFVANILTAPSFRTAVRERFASVALVSRTTSRSLSTSGTANMDSSMSADNMATVGSINAKNAAFRRTPSLLSSTSSVRSSVCWNVPARIMEDAPIPEYEDAVVASVVPESPLETTGLMNSIHHSLGSQKSWNSSLCPVYIDINTTPEPATILTDQALPEQDESPWAQDDSQAAYLAPQELATQQTTSLRISGPGDSAGGWL